MYRGGLQGWDRLVGPDELHVTSTHDQELLIIINHRSLWRRTLRRDFSKANTSRNRSRRLSQMVDTPAKSIWKPPVLTYQLESVGLNALQERAK